MRVEFSDVRFGYRSKNGASKKVFSGLSFSLSAGECVGIMGHEGAGKSTLLQLMAGLLKPDAGIIRVDGKDIWRQRGRISAVRRRIGCAFQFPEQQFFCETVNDELLYAHRNFQDQRAVGLLNPEEALIAVGLAARDYLHRSPFLLSMGEARRVALATVLVTKPEAFLLDEPTVGLDGAGIDMVLDLLRRVKQEGASIALVSHDVDVLAEVASRIILVGDGGVLVDGPVQQILTNERLLSDHGYELPEVVRFMKDAVPRTVEFCRFADVRTWFNSTKGT